MWSFDCPCIVAVLLPIVAQKMVVSIDYAAMQLYECMIWGSGRAYDHPAYRFPHEYTANNHPPSPSDSEGDTEDVSAYAPHINRVPFVVQPAATAPREHDQWQLHDVWWQQAHLWEDPARPCRYTWYGDEEWRMSCYIGQTFAARKHRGAGTGCTTPCSDSTAKQLQQ